ncbi:MAG: armadillo-type protein [Olpidium bornovanus]|uniref:Armadillo-type protein n=1 Tax=Olpidium bornovanus TaxID=278681 RepID=A0A8H8DG06_9FUNG|nr:MAG: armadillo-type protein [Olpidium bornovanus]
MISEAVAPDLMRISLNMHGTRAVQKMIDYISNPIQIRSLTVAFASNVVILIKDLNGNHVIQKCLYKLSSENNQALTICLSLSFAYVTAACPDPPLPDLQFIYDAVSQHCIEVATHRHGCCVLQRCIDHASDAQKIQLVTEITCNALTLVQDPFGNYVVQYVLDLGDARFSETIVRRFIGNVSLLSVQKFSSNVMEKVGGLELGVPVENRGLPVDECSANCHCIRVTDNETRWRLIDEMLNQERLDKLLRDSYGNYVVQTALDYADPLQRAKVRKERFDTMPRSVLCAWRLTGHVTHICACWSVRGARSAGRVYTSTAPGNSEHSIRKAHPVQAPVRDPRAAADGPRCGRRRRRWRKRRRWRRNRDQGLRARTQRGRRCRRGRVHALRPRFEFWRLWTPRFQGLPVHVMTAPGCAPEARDASRGKKQPVPSVLLFV